MEALKPILNQLFELSGRKSGARAFETVFAQLNAEFKTDIEKRKTHFAHTNLFNTIIGCLIVLNAMLMGIEVDMGRGGGWNDRDRMVFFGLDLLFFVAFFVEMLTRMNQLGWDYFVDPWNIFDYLLVVLNCSDLVISFNNEGAAGLKLATTLRALRLLRVVRVIRGVKLFHGLWIIIQGLLDSLLTVTWVGVLFLLVTYCIAVIITTLTIDNPIADEYWLQREQYLGTPWRSMWTVIQVITLDRWAVDVARPLLEVSPVAVLFLIIAITVCTFGITNIIVAVMVEHLQTIMEETSNVSNKVLEATELDIMTSMGEEFQMADLDGNGELAREEFVELLHSEKIVEKLRLLSIEVHEAEQIFDLMDADKSGTVSPEEFIGGLTKLKGTAKGQDLVALICFAEKQCARAVQFVERIQQLNAKADVIQERLDSLGHGMTKVIEGRKYESKRNEDVWKEAGERQRVIGTMDLNRQIEFPALKGGNARYGILY